MKRFSRLFPVFLLLAMTFLALGVHAQGDKGSLTGHVTDSSGSVLQGAEVELQPTGATVATDQQGSYFVKDLPPGTYTITVTYVGFSLFTKVLHITAGQPITVDAKMEVSSQRDQIIVTSERTGAEAEEVNRQRTADNIVQVLTADVITSLPNANIADALGRLPSVTLERDEGEGKYVQIRGTAPELTNVTIDGINVPSPEPGVRQIKLDTIPADLVDSVEINKTLQANMDGDGIGGSVNLVTKMAEDRPTIALFGSGGYTPIVNGRKVTENSGSVGQRFGSSKKFGLLFAGHYDWNGRGIDDIEPVPDAIQPVAGGPITPYYDSMDIREYRYNRTRWGFASTADYKLGEGSSIYMRVLYSDFKDYGDKWVYTLNDNSGLTGLPTDNTPGFSGSSRRPDYAIGSLLLGGRHDLSSTWFAWDVSVARSRQLDSGGNPGPDYSYVGPNSACQYNPAGTTDQYRPQWLPICYTEAYNQANYQLQDIVLSYGLSPQLNLQGSGAFGKRYHIGSHLATIEIGGKFRNNHKFDNSYTVGWQPTLALPNTMFLSNFTNSNYYNNSYPAYGPVPDFYKILAYFHANPGNFTEEAYDPNGNTTIGGNGGNFDLVEKVSAGYVMNTIDLGKFHVVAGLRIEGTNLGTDTFTTTQPSDPTLNPVYSFTRANGSYINILPSASVRYALTNDSGIRLVYGRGLSRPDPQDIAQAYTISNVPPISASLGNPSLKAETANNYDLLYEKYFRSIGMFQTGVFYKDLSNPIVDSTTFPTSGQFAGYKVSQWVNLGSAWVGGFEVAYLQHYTSLPGMLGGLGLSANYSYTDSRASGLESLGRSDHPPLTRQAPNTWNISPTYDRGRFSIRVGMSYNSASIYTYQYVDGAPFGKPGPFGDTYFYPHFQLDAQGSIRLAKGFTAIVSGLNLNNEVFGFYNGSPQYVLQREFYQPTFSLGLRWSPTHEK